MVYSHAFVERSLSIVDEEDSFARDIGPEEPIDVTFNTNLDLIAMVGCAGAVKRILIFVQCVDNPLPGLREVIQRMGAVASKWRVVDLEVEVYSSRFRDENPDVDVSEYIDDVAEVADALAALMPGVRHLYCAGYLSNQLVSSLNEHLVRNYAGQLQRLTSPRPISMLPERQLARLQHVSIDFKFEDEYRLPRMASGELISVSLDKAPCNHSWAAFSTNRESQVIEFAKLRKLDVVYLGLYEVGGVAVHHRDRHPWELRFPSLESLSIQNTRGICPLLEYAVLPPRMESISIEMSWVAFQQFAHVELPKTENISLGIARSSAGNPSGLAVINHLLKNADDGQSLELSIGDDRLPVALETITSRALTHLAILGPVSVDTMFAFIEQMPRLTELALHNISLSDIQIDTSIPEADDDAIVEPLSKSLRILSIKYSDEGYVSDTAVAVAKCVLLRIPTLVELYAAQTRFHPLLAFVKAYKARHPHLGGVEMKAHVRRIAEPVLAF
ncbi:hypothetical protein H4R19_002461 [Coemansia spiralis]|nr:hypothetical protein H4R19_002461 [Coemansia spiralis]